MGIGNNTHFFSIKKLELKILGFIRIMANRVKTLRHGIYSQPFKNLGTRIEFLLINILN